MFFIHVRESFRKPAMFIKFNYLEALKIFAVVTDAQCSNVTNVRNLSLMLEKLLREAVVFLKISQNSQENTCDRVSFLIKLQACRKGVLRNFAKLQNF